MEIVFLKNHCNYKKGETVNFLVENHAEELIRKGVAEIPDKENTADKPKKAAKK